MGVIINIRMDDQLISQLNIATAVLGTDYLIVDNEVETKRATVNTLSSFLVNLNGTYLNTTNISNSFVISQVDYNAKMLIYSGVQNITAYIDNALNTVGANTTVAQLSTGTITINLSAGYNARLVSYNSLYTTAGVGAVASIGRVSNGVFLLTGLLQ